MRRKPLKRFQEIATHRKQLHFWTTHKNEREGAYKLTLAVHASDAT